MLGVLFFPFGDVEDLSSKPNPWHGIEEEGAVFVFARAEKFTGVSRARCEAMTSALKKLDYGIEVAAKRLDFSSAWKAWGPWSEDDNEAVADCDGSPCKVKINAAEGAKMKAAPEADRKAEFFKLVVDRAKAYVSGGVRPGYEFDGPIADPWVVFEKQGLKNNVAAMKPRIFVRRYDMEKMRPIRQVLDVRLAETRGRGASVWVRDVYVAHYFDSWGELHELTCDPKAKTAALIQGLVLEVDQMKSKSFFWIFGRGKVKSIAREQGPIYLDKIRDKLVK